MYTVKFFRQSDAVPVDLEFDDQPTLQDVFNHPESGRAVEQGGSFAEAAEALFGGVEASGEFRMTDSQGNDPQKVQLTTKLPNESIIAIVPRIEAGAD
jgi:hypothetical protein